MYMYIMTSALAHSTAGANQQMNPEVYYSYAQNTALHLGRRCDIGVDESNSLLEESLVVLERVHNALLGTSTLVDLHINRLLHNIDLEVHL